jgi:hypothetical protein
MRLTNIVLKKEFFSLDGYQVMEAGRIVPLIYIETVCVSVFSHFCYVRG